MSLSGAQEQNPIQYESEGILSQAISLSSQPSLPSLPSLESHSPSITPSLHECITTLKGHSSYVSALAVDGDALYSASSDGHIRLWPLDTSSHQSDPSSSTIAISKSPVKSLIANGNGLLSSHQDSKIRVWQFGRSKDSRRLVLRAILPTVVDRLWRFLLPKNYVEVRRHKKCTWVHHVDAVSALALSPDRALLYSVSWDRSLKVWRLSDFRCMESIAPAHDDAINAIAVSPVGHVYTGSADTKIKVWKCHPGQKKHALVGTLARHRSAVNALALGVDGQVLYSGACDRSVVVWEGAGGHMAATGTLRGHTMAILCLAATGDVVCSGSADRTVRVWRRGGEKGYTCLAVLEGHGGAAKSLALVGRDDYSCCAESSSCGSSVLVCSGALDCDVKVWRVFVPCLVQD